ncbi:MAG: 4Fe-4S binding protein [Syntrophomonas sp.]
MLKRNIIKIDQDLCNGCGLCIGPCSEGALVLENGKVEVVKEELSTVPACV